MNTTAIYLLRYCLGVIETHLIWARDIGWARGEYGRAEQLSKIAARLCSKRGWRLRLRPRLFRWARPEKAGHTRCGRTARMEFGNSGRDWRNMRPGVMNRQLGTI
ncbi:unnamed protein product [Prunus armeniaca]|uniref:Uncharacterized protein n=1 Tax=Prunus armeniaca TaxID=36596 RepID=A0A6J5U7I7_PRUAR|nr:unnamed protein product [Prunus armeniaca]